jgi:hypothetical protein
MNILELGAVSAMNRVIRNKNSLSSGEELPLLCLELHAPKFCETREFQAIAAEAALM